MQKRDDQIRHYQTFINGEWVDAVSGARFESEDPFTAKVWATLPRCGEEDVDRAVKAARAALLG